MRHRVGPVLWQAFFAPHHIGSVEDAAIRKTGLGPPLIESDAGDA
jgi:hypothetical protein